MIQTGTIDNVNFELQIQLVTNKADELQLQVIVKWQLARQEKKPAREIFDL